MSWMPEFITSFTRSKGGKSYGKDRAKYGARLLQNLADELNLADTDCQIQSSRGAPK